MTAPAILWDFDGTLGQRAASFHGVPSGLWSPCLIEVLDELEPGHGIDAEKLRPHLRGGFPWHRPDEPHLDLCDPDAWWAHVEPVFTRAFDAAGFGPERAQQLARAVRARYVDPSGWMLYDDTLPVLRGLREDGWRHAVVSNHVPELDHIVGALGVGDLVDAVICSARIGYEKPHPRTFEIALERLGHLDDVWMVGDNPEADVRGAEAVGIPAIHVRGRRVEGVRRYSPDLDGVRPFLGAR